MQPMTDFGSPDKFALFIYSQTIVTMSPCKNKTEKALVAKHHILLRLVASVNYNH